MRALQLCNTILRLDMGCEVEVIIQPEDEEEAAAGRWKVERVVPELKDVRGAEPEVTKLVLVCRARAITAPEAGPQERPQEGKRQPLPPQPGSARTLCRYIRGLFD